MKQQINIILIDRDSDTVSDLSDRLESEKKFSVDVAKTPKGADKKLAKNEYDVAIVDINGKGFRGVETLSAYKKLDYHLEVIVYTGDESLQQAVAATKEGAFEYRSKSSATLNDIAILATKAWELKRLYTDDAPAEIDENKVFEYKIVGQSEPIHSIHETIRKAAPTNATVLILGESGTGKELIARDIHNNSRRSEKPFIAVNCANLSKDLFESTLFGHAKGAFTGANDEREGLVKAADQGTLFLDEIIDIGPENQAKLLRFLEDQTFRRVGENEEHSVDVRVIAATNKDLFEAVKKGSFRGDLYYRLNLITIIVPALRERSEDIPLLIDHFLQNSEAAPAKKIHSTAVEVLQKYQWQGNIRELKNVVERLKILSTGDEISLQDIENYLQLPEIEHHDPEQKKTLKYTLEEIEKRHIEKVLRSFQGNKPKAAESLGISLRSLYNKIKQYDLQT